MSPRLTARFVFVSLGVALAASAALGYIHLPPRTLQDTCKTSNHIRLLKIEKLNKEKGVIVFALSKSLKGEKSDTNSFKHIVRTDAEGVMPILDWAEEGKMAVMFSVEIKRGGPTQEYGYVFLDGYCYSVDYNNVGKYWLMLRAEPEMLCCYYGSVEQLRQAVEDILNGKEIKVPTKEPDAKVNPVKRVNEIMEMEIKNKRTKEIEGATKESEANVNPDMRVKGITELEVKNQHSLEITPTDETKAILPEANSGNLWLKAAWIVGGMSASIAVIWFGWRMVRGVNKRPTQ